MYMTPLWKTPSTFPVPVCLVQPTLMAVTTPVQALQGAVAVLQITVGVPVNPILVKENFIWTFGGTPQNSSSIQTSGNLLLTNVQPSQTGVYTCTAVNTGGNGSTTVRLEVLGG